MNINCALYMFLCRDHRIFQMFNAVGSLIGIASATDAMHIEKSVNAIKVFFIDFILGQSISLG
jgi:hypothetical protein